ncbi:MAG TPA: hypothetical protein VK906_08330 [Egicoccus sp.]|nr:hypothetical protein [Egicoccus sp.]HSK23167.1 hypothetical protein [Egicoccus sp.]
MLAPRTPRAARTAMVISVATLVTALTALSVIDARHLHPARPLLLGLLAVVFVSTSAALVLFEQRHGSNGFRAHERPDSPPVSRRDAGPAPRRKV